MTKRETFRAFAVMLAGVASGCGSPEKISFANDVTPILQERCADCHAAGGEGELASGFNIESYQAVMSGTKFGPVIEPGSSISSSLVILIEHKAHPSINMPKSQKGLDHGEIQVIKTWIDQGALDN